MQDTARPKGELGRGFTLEQLYRSAAEIGVDPGLVLKAAEELQGTAIVSAKPDSSSPTVVERDFLTPITEADYPDILEFLRATTKSAGSAQVIGGTLEWTTVDMKSQEMIHLVIIPSKGSTKVRIRYTNPFALIFNNRWLFAVTALIMVMAFIPTLTFGGKFFSWTELIPFVALAAFLGSLPRLFFGLRLRPKGGVNKGYQLMDSIGHWLDTRSLP